MFTQSGSTWVAPAGFDGTLTGSSTHTLTYNKSGEHLQFNSSGWLTADQDRNGVGNTYTYGSNGQVSTVTDAAGRSYAVTWNSSGLMATVTDSAGRRTTYSQNPQGQLGNVMTSDGYQETYNYDSSGRINNIVATGTNNNVTTTLLNVQFGYDSSSRLTSISEGAIGTTPAVIRQTTFAYSSGQTTVTDPNGKVATYSIDSSGRVTSTTTPRGNTRSQTWNSADTVATSTDALASGSTPGNSTTYSYDSLNNATKVSFPTGAAASATYAQGTGCSGTTGSSYQVHCSVDDAGNGQQLDYDSAGNLTRAKDTTSGGTGAVTNTYTYASAASGCGAGSPNGFAGQICSATDGDGNTTNYAYDTAGNLLSVTPPTPMHATTYAYDSLGRVTSVTDPNGHTTSYQYNQRDQILTSTFADSVVESTTYYPNALVDQESENANNSITYSYDVLGQITQQQTVQAGTSSTVTFTHDPAGNVLTYADPNGTVTYGYDADNDLTSITQPSGSCSSGPTAGSGCITITYNGNDQETARTFPGGATVTQTIDAAGRVTRIVGKDTSGTTNYDTSYSFQAAGTTGSTGDRSNIQTMTATVGTGVPTGGTTTSYTYDSLNRLTQALEKTSTGSTNASWAYTYDNEGNRTQQVLSGSLGTAPGAPTAGTTTYHYNADNELTSTSADTSTWAYDSAGDTLTDGITGTASVFNSRGGLETTGATPATYTAFGQGNTDTTQRTDGATTTAYGTSPLGLDSESSGTPVEYDQTPGGTAVALRNGTTRAYYVFDELGSVVGMYDASGHWIGGYNYTPYGEARTTDSAATATGNHLQYIGGYWDTSAKLYRLGARYYNPTTGRFTQYDPSGQEVNPYAYARANPINNLDPTGYTVVALTKIISRLLAGASIFDILNGSPESDGELVGLAIGLACDLGVAALAPATAGLDVVIAFTGCEAADQLSDDQTNDLLEHIKKG